MEGFLSRFVDDFSPQVDGNTTGTSQTVRSAAGIRMFSPVLSDAFKAVALTYFGHDVADQRIERTGSQIHVSVLRKLQEAIYNMQQTNSQGILLTVCLLMCFEVWISLPIMPMYDNIYISLIYIYALTEFSAHDKRFPDESCLWSPENFGIPRPAEPYVRDRSFLFRRTSTILGKFLVSAVYSVVFYI